MFERKSLTWPIALAIVMIVLIGGLAVGWVLLSVFGAQESDRSPEIYWALLSVGSVMFACVLTGVILYLVLSIKQHNLSARQANFIDAVTHELKSPLATLKLYLQTLNRRNIDEAQRQQFYDSMLSEVDRLDQLINQLLDVARLSHAGRSPEDERASVRVDRLIRELVDAAGLRLGVEAPPVQYDLEPVELLCRKTDLEIVARNLIDNAIKYAGHPPEVRIAAHVQRETQQLHLTFENNGNTIPRHKRRAVFDRFYRLGNELERTKPGTGLGLFLVKLIVRRMKGSIVIDDTAPPQPTRFRVVLPHARAVVEQEAPERAPEHSGAVR